MKLADLFLKLAKKVGIDTDSENFKKITLPDVDVPDEMATSLDTKLLTEQAALSNTKIRNTIKAESLNGIDSLINILIEEGQYQDTDSIKNAASSYERVKAFHNHVVKAYEQKVKDATKPGANVDKASYDKQIADLNEAIRVTKQSLADKEKEFNSTRETDLTNFEIHKLLLGKEYSLPKEMDADLKVQTAFAAVNKQLQAKGFKVIRENGQLVVVDKDNKPAYSDSHEPIQVGSFFDGVLAQNKLLKVNDQQDGGSDDKTRTDFIPGNGNNGQPKPPANFQKGLETLETMIIDESKAGN